MDKVAYETAVYTAFFDELEKLGYDLDGLEKDAILGAIGKGMAGMAAKAGKGLRAAKGALTPSSMKMQAGLAKPSMTAVGAKPAELMARSKAVQTGGAAVRPGFAVNPQAAGVRQRTSSALQGARQSMAPSSVGAGSMIR